MSKPLLLHHSASAEYVAAAAWYEERRAGLGADFVGAVDAAMERVVPLEQHATAATRRGVRVVRIKVRGFPYRLVVVELPDVILVVAVAHTSRRPNYWADRLT